MDERYVSDRFHEALELEPNAGAYERFRSNFTNPTAGAKARPVFRMRFSQMSIRLIAVAAAVAVAIALVAGYLATHQKPPTGNIPVTTNTDTKAYVALIEGDYQSMQDASSAHCATIQDQGCEAAVSRLAPVLVKWVNDLNRFQTPTKFAVLDTRLRAHLTAAVAELNAAVAFQKQNNNAGFTMAMSAVLFERGWLDPASFELEGTFDPVASSYKDAMRQAKRSLDSCVTGASPDTVGCTRLSGGMSPSGGEACPPAQAAACEADVQFAEGQIQDRLIEITQFAPPANDVAQNALYVTRLTAADDDVLAMTDALLKGDSSKFNALELAYSGAISGAKSYADSLAST